MRSALAALALGVVLALAGAGCGGIDTGKLESAIKDQTNKQLERGGRSERVSTASCTKTSDAYHFTCDLANDAGTTLLVVDVTCAKSGTCKWTRQR
jgi:hypothetical protein